MTDESDAKARWREYGRRTVLQTFGAGAALAATGGVVGPAAAAETGDGDDPLHPTFGYPSTGEEEPPVEPDHEVELHVRPREDAPVPEFYYQPTGLAIEPGDVVRFSYVTGHHTVTAYHPGFGQVRRVPESVPPFSAPVLPQGGYWLYRFDAPGVYDYHCGPHELLGHAGRLVVGSTEGFEPLPDPCAGQSANGEGDAEGEEALRPPQLTAYTVLRDPALDPERILERGQTEWDDLAPESKQLFVQISGFPPCGPEC